MSMLESAQRLVPDQKVLAVATGQTGVYPMLWWLPYGEFLTMFNGRRLVAVTDSAIVVMEAGRWSTRRAKRVLLSVPRVPVLTPSQKRWARVELGTERIWMHRRMRRFLEHALAGAPAVATPDAGSTVPDPAR